MAQEDLRNWASRTEYSDQTWIDMCTQIIDGIRDCHDYLQISHNDLHTANVLVTYVDNELLYLIHDFGRSELLTKYNWKNDYDKIFDDLQRFENMSIDISKTTDIILDSETEEELQEKLYKFFC